MTDLTLETPITLTLDMGAWARIDAALRIVGHASRDRRTAAVYAGTAELVAAKLEAANYGLPRNDVRESAAAGDTPTVERMAEVTYDPDSELFAWACPSCGRRTPYRYQLARTARAAATLHARKHHA